jgi:hypothetical protein
MLRHEVLRAGEVVLLRHRNGILRFECCSADEVATGHTPWGEHARPSTYADVQYDSNGIALDRRSQLPQS